MIKEKIVLCSKAWTCSNMDTDAPIEWEGYEILTTLGRRFFVDNINATGLQFANKDEIKQTALKFGYVCAGQEVEVTKGKTLPIGSKHTIDKFFTYKVNGTYGKCDVNYTVFTDGTKININNIKPVGIELFQNTTTCLQYSDKWYLNFNLGGRQYGKIKLGVNLVD